MGVMERIVSAIINTLSRELGPDLENAYLYGSMVLRTYEMGESDINLLLITSNNVDVHQLRAVFYPLWQEYGRQLKRAPLVATRSQLARHFLLNPAFAHHLIEDGQPLINTSGLLAELPSPPELAPPDKYAALAHEVMLASTVLASQPWPSDQAAAQRRKLHGLARRIFREPINPQETAVTTFARIQAYLAPKIKALPIEHPWESMRTATSPLLPGLQATYTKDLEKILLVFNQLTPEQLQAISWDKLAVRLAKDYKGIYVTSSPQLRLIHQYETPLDLVFRRSKRTWGMDPLADIPATNYYKLRQTARIPSHILIDSLPNAYLTQDETEFGKIIHDFQNKMLNVQLETELLSRMNLIGQTRPLMPLPGREAPPQTRIDAIFNLLNWWAEQLTNAMQQAAA